MSENEIRVLYVQPGKYPEERTIPNTLRALQELVGGDIECCRPWRDSVCVICNDSGRLTVCRLTGFTDIQIFLQVLLWSAAMAEKTLSV